LDILLVVACALVDEDRRVLIAKRSNNKSSAGKWEFPGGKIEKNETPEEALIRELDEELDIKTQEACLAPLTFSSYSYENFHLLMPFYVCRKWQGQPRLQKQTDLIAHQELKWIKPRDLHKFEMLKADIPLIAHLCDLL